MKKDMENWVDELNAMGIFADPSDLRRHLEAAADKNHEMAVWLRLLLNDYSRVETILGSEVNDAATKH